MSIITLLLRVKYFIRWATETEISWKWNYKAKYRDHSDAQIYYSISIGRPIVVVYIEKLLFMGMIFVLHKIASNEKNIANKVKNSS